MSWKNFIPRYGTPSREYRVAALMIFASLILIMFFITKYSNNSSNFPHRTLAIIKPDVVAAGYASDIIKQIDNNGFKIAAQKELTIDKTTAEQFYAAHKNKPFFNDLIAYITSGPSIILVLERTDAVNVWRNLMGATDPKKASPGTVRQLYGTDIQQNAVHGSDSLENAQREIALFFP